jgi:hypothetical protein
MTERIGQSFSPHQEKVLGILGSAKDIYAERAAVYKDNYKVVGRVMEALFPDGAPALMAREDYDRWHIFELMIVKLTRYTNNYGRPHQDSLDDLLVYAAILGALDRELYENEAKSQADEDEFIRATKAAGLFPTKREDLLPDYEPVTRLEPAFAQPLEPDELQTDVDLLDGYEALGQNDDREIVPDFEPEEPVPGFLEDEDDEGLDPGDNGN